MIFLISNGLFDNILLDMSFMSFYHQLFMRIVFNTTGVEIRLAGANQYEGRVEILYNGAWGTICDDYWTGDSGKRNAEIVCR